MAIEVGRDEGRIGYTLEEVRFFILVVRMGE